VCEKPRAPAMSLPPTPARNDRSELRQLVRLALPLALAQAGHAAMGTVDTAVVGRAGAVQLAGVGLGNGLFFAISFMGIGLLMGADPLISQAVGAGDPVRARRIYWQAVYAAFAASAALAIPLLLVPLGIPPEVARSATRFLHFRIPGLLPMLLFFAARAYLQAVGHARWLLWVVILANVLNLGGDLLFVFGGAELPAWTGPLRCVPPLGAAGAALVTTTATAFEFGVLAMVITRVRLPGGPHRGLHAPLAGDLKSIARVGIPIGLHYTAEVGSFALAGFLAGLFGAPSLAAHQIALTYGSLTFTFAAGIGNAGSVRVGYAVGAGDSRAARRAGLLAFGAGAVFMGCMALLFLLFPRGLVAVMTDAPDIARLAVPLLMVTAVFQVSDGIQGVGAGVLRGAGDSRFTFVANLVGHWLIGLPVALLLGFTARWGVLGIWWGLAAGLSAVAVALLWRFLRLSSEEIQPLHASP
jgi:multidrug resistance protein, MATE family